MTKLFVRAILYAVAALFAALAVFEIVLMKRDLATGRGFDLGGCLIFIVLCGLAAGAFFIARSGRLDRWLSGAAKAPLNERKARPEQVARCA